MQEFTDIPVNMIPIGEEALRALYAELSSARVCGKKQIYNIPASFDTETSSFEDEEDNPVGLLYIWMFGINNVVVYGRTLEEFEFLVTRLNDYLEDEHAQLYVYVHNLKFDFAFIKTLFRWDDTFIPHMREPLYARVRNITFRDSLALSGGRSLATIGKDVLRVKIQKAVGDLDYDLIRTPKTPLTSRELHYCEMDIRVLNEYIREKIEDDGGILKIPYTNTGYVRNYVRDKCFENRGRYMELIDRCTMTPDCCLQAEWAV